MEISDDLQNSKTFITRMSPLRHCNIGKGDKLKELIPDLKKMKSFFPTSQSVILFR